MNHIMAWVCDCSLQVGSVEEVEHHTPKAQDENYQDSSFHLTTRYSVEICWRFIYLGNVDFGQVRNHLHHHEEAKEGDKDGGNR